MKKYFICASVIMALFSGYVFSYLLEHVNSQVQTEIKEVEVTKVEYVEVEKEVEVEVIVEKEPEYVYSVTAVERELLARLVYREGGAESIESQRAIVSVVMNRLQNGRWGNSIEEVIYSKGQFAVASILYKTTPNEESYQAVDYVLKNGATVPYYVMFFSADHHFKWQDYRAYTKIDKTCFGYIVSDK